MDNSREQNYWPGFVDALSNVVLTLVFVIVIFVFALVMGSNKVEQKMQQIIQNDPSKDIKAAENAELKKQLAAMTVELKQLRARVSQNDVQLVSNNNEQIKIAVKDEGDKNDPKKTTEGPVQVKSSTNTIDLAFPVAIAQMDQKSLIELDHVLQPLVKVVSKHKVVMRSIIGKETYSVARRLAYYRALNLRSYLISKLGENPADIIISIVTPQQPEDGHVEIVYKKEE